MDGLDRGIFMLHYLCLHVTVQTILLRVARNRSPRLGPMFKARDARQKGVVRVSELA